MERRALSEQKFGRASDKSAAIPDRIMVAIAGVSRFRKSDIQSRIKRASGVPERAANRAEATVA